MKKAAWLWLALAGAGINSCTSPLEQMPEKVVVTADPAIRLPLGDPLKGDASLGGELKKALDIDAKSIGPLLYDYIDPLAPQDRKFFLYQKLVEQQIDITEYKQSLTVGPDGLVGLPKTVRLKDYLPAIPSLPATLPDPGVTIPLSATVTITNEKILEITGSNSGLSLVCKGSKTIPDTIRVQSAALNLDHTKTKAKGEVVFGPVMSFTGGDFTLTPEEGHITIDIAITMTFKDIVDTNTIGITPDFIFNWTEVKLDLSQEIGDDLKGSYPDTSDPAASPIKVSGLKESLFDGKLQFQKVPFYVYVNGPQQWFENENITMKLNTSYKVEAGETTTDLLYDGPLAAVPLPAKPPGQSYSPKTSISQLASSVVQEEDMDLADVFNQAPEELGFDYDIGIGEYIVTPSMLTSDSIAFEAVMILVIPLAYTVGEEIDLARDFNGFDMPDFGDSDLLGREEEGDTSQVFDFIKGIRLDVDVDNRLGLNGELRLYANKFIQEDGGEPLGSLELEGSTRLELGKNELSETFPFSPAFAICIPEGNELIIKRTIDDNPFGVKLTIWVDGSINQEITL